MKSRSYHVCRHVQGLPGIGRAAPVAWRALYSWDRVAVDWHHAAPRVVWEMAQHELVMPDAGLPRQGFEWLLKFGRAGPRTELALLGTFQPTNKLARCSSAGISSPRLAGSSPRHARFLP